MQLIDTHCHFDFPELAGQQTELLARMAENDVIGALCAAVTLEAFPALRAMVEAQPRLLGSVGVHPDHQEGEEPDVARLVTLAENPKIVAIGETGLDYYRLTGDLEWQRNRFRVHIRAARESGKPLIIHTRSAASDTLRVMREESAHEAGGIMHCFTEDWEVATAALDMGFHISFSGIITFRNAESLREVVRRMPLDRILIETDAPYLAPVPHRGRLNQPAYVRHVAEEIARVRAMSLEEVARITTDNFLRLVPSARAALGIVS